MTIARYHGRCPHCGHDHDADNESFQRALAAPSAASGSDAAHFDGHFLEVGEIERLRRELGETRRMLSEECARSAERSTLPASFVRLADVHRGWCNYCKGVVEVCRAAPEGGCSLRDVEREASGETAEPSAMIIEHRRRFDSSETMPLKYTDTIVDAPRQILAYAETPGRTLEGLRIYLRQCGVKFEDCWPDWAYENGHLTKGGLAELVHRMMEAARYRDQLNDANRRVAELQEQIKLMRQHEDEMRATDAGSWLPLLEMFSEKEVLLHGAAGEVAMNVGDVIKIVRALAAAQLRTFAHSAERRLDALPRFSSALQRDARHPEKHWAAMLPTEIGEWVRFDDVQALLANPPAPSSELTNAHEALKLAQEWKGRADDAGRLSRAVIASASSELTSEERQELLTLREYGTAVTKENERLMAEVSNRERDIANLIAERDAASSHERSSVPDGWKLVPIEPTEAMLGAAAFKNFHHQIYSAMVKAAPDAPASAIRSSE
jgi:hypothetical protein